MIRRHPVAARISTLFLTVFAPAAGLCIAADKPADEAVELRISPRPKAGATVKIAVPSSPKLDQNAAPLYADAARLIQPVAGRDFLDTVRDDGLSEEGEMILEENRPIMDKLRQAARCSKCVWDDPPAMEGLSRYRLLSRLVVLQIRHDMAARRYPQAAEALSAGYALARALNAQETSLLSGMVGVAIAGVMNEQAIWMLSRPDMPALDLSGLPIPLLDLQPQIAREQAEAPSKIPNPAAAAPVMAQLKSSHAQVQAIAAKAERQLDVLRAIEILRASAASNGGKLPETLPPAATATRPAGTQPAAKPPITYRRTGPTTAILTVSLPAAKGKPTQLTYRLTLAVP